MVHALKSKMKTMLTVFFDWRRIIHREFLSVGHTMTMTFYQEILERLLNQVRRVQREMWDVGEWFFILDNATSHSSLIVKLFLAKKGYCD